MAITVQQFIDRHPLLFHMAEPGSWPSIQRHGLLSTSALLDLFQVSGGQRLEIESRHRPEKVVIQHPTSGEATIRDQKPLNESKLRSCLIDL